MEKEGSNVVKIYDISNQKCPLLKTKLLSVSEVDMCTCMCMCNVLPSKASQATRPVGTKDFRGKDIVLNFCSFCLLISKYNHFIGNKSTSFLQEIIIMGMTSGSLIFLDTLADMDVVFSYQVNSCIVI